MGSQFLLASPKRLHSPVRLIERVCAKKALAASAICAALAMLFFVVLYPFAYQQLVIPAQGDHFGHSSSITSSASTTIARTPSRTTTLLLASESDAASTKFGAVLSPLPERVDQLAALAVGDQAEQDSLALIEYPVGEALVIAAHQSDRVARHARILREKKIMQFFARKWRGDKQLFATFSADFELIASYYAKHDHAYQLVQQLYREPVYFSYAANTFRTDVKATPFDVQSVRIFFDPRRAAVFSDQTRSRISGSREPRVSQMISSADALLHELLHANVVLQDEHKFAGQGVAASTFYPHEHEQTVIALERDLFSAMTVADGVARPLRHRHEGFLLASSCATCLQ